MKKFVAVLAVVAFLALVFALPAMAQGENPPTAPASGETAPLTLPDALQGLIAVGVGFLVTQGLKAMFVKNGLDLSGVAAQITGGIVTSIIAFGNFLLSLVPAAYVDPVSIILTLIVSLFGVAGLHYSYSALKSRK